MRVIANLFLILFFADGCISLGDELLALIAPVTALAGVRNVLAGAVIVMAVPVYLCLGIDRRLTKRVFLPLIVFVFWCPVSTWLFPVLAGYRTYGLLAAVAQVALCVLPLSRFRHDGAPSLTMPPALFDAPLFSRTNTLVFGAVNLIVIPLALVMFVLYVTNAYMAEYTSGFMYLGPGGLRMTERVYRRDTRTIRLAGMIHVGEKNYYDDLAGSVARGSTIVLAEGVTDDDNLLVNSFDYGRVAGFLGLTSQDTMLFRGRFIEEEELDLSRSRSRSRVADKKAQSGPVDILRADLDISDFRPPTITLLDAVGKQLRESPTFVKGFLALNTWAEKNITPEMNDVIMDDVLHRRNLEVIRLLEKALDRYETVIIPWGALHMKEIEAEVLKRGFVLQEERERVSIDFRKMLLGKL